MAATTEIAIPRIAEPTTASLTMPAALHSARKARTFTAQAMRRWGGAEDIVEAAVLIVCELTTNAIRHGSGPVTLRLLLKPHALHIEVHDGSVLPPVKRTARRDEDSGRGMLIVDALADTWSCGTAPEGGKWVRATVALRTTG
ncbi:ATP-binding protein [Streptomyces coerulescens]|uniref:ATP-binding protein n=1 Tax=Streptomyces coerulescens TaxID=29304 RepID=A0ABW0CJ79_STRCD